MENPKIRFKGFTKDWEQRKLGATNTFFTDGNYGEAYPKSSDMTDSGSGVPFLTGGNLKDGKLSLDGASYITPEKHSKLTSGHLLEDDIVIAVRGSLGALGYVNTDNSGWNINSQLAILRTDKSELYGKFLIQYLLSWTGQNELLKRQTGSALKQLPIGAIKDVEVPITSIAEQEKIGEYFDSVDHLITLHQRKCEQTKKLKKYMLQKMFPQNGAKVPEIRFDGFTYDWEQRKLRECAEFNPKSELPDVFEYIDLESVVGTNILSHRTESKSSAPSRAQRLAQKGDVFYQTVRPYQKNNCIFEKNDNNWVFSTGYAQLRPVNDSYFLLTLLQNEDFVKLVLDRCTGTSYPAINSNDLADIDVNVPSDSKEQQQIGTYFKQLDHLITLHQRQTDFYKKISFYYISS